MEPPTSPGAIMCSLATHTQKKSFPSVTRSLEARRHHKSSTVCSAVILDSHSEPMEVDTTLSPRVNSVKPSKSVAITDQATALVEAGVPVIRLDAGEPDFDTPAVIAEVAGLSISVYMGGSWPSCKTSIGETPTTWVVMFKRAQVVGAEISTAREG